MTRRALMAGNWKMHKTAAEAKLLAEQVAAFGQGATDRDILLAPPFTALGGVAEAVKGTGIIVAGQNVCWEEQGAFTGEISPLMLKDLGASAAIVGHSERRQIFRETDEMINRRLRGGLDQGLLASRHLRPCRHRLATRRATRRTRPVRSVRRARHRPAAARCPAWTP